MGKSNKDITTQSLQGVFWLLASKMGIAMLRILSVAVLARLLSPEDFGLVQGATIVTSFVEVFSMLGVAPALVQFKKLNKEHISTAFTFSIAFGCLLSLLLWFSADYIEGFFQFNDLSEVLKTLVLLFPINSISVVSQNLLYRKLDYQKIAKADIFGFSGYAISGVVLALLGWEYWALVFAHYVSSTIKSILLFFFQPHSIRPSINYSAFSELFHFGSGITLSSFFNYIAMKGDYLIIGRFLGANALGIYGRSYNLMASSVSLFGSVLDKVLFAAMARKQDDTEKLQIAFRRCVSIVGFTVLPVSVFAILLAPEIIGTFLGNDWQDAIVPFQVLASTMVLRIGYKMNGALARAKGLVFKLAGRQAFYATAILIGSYVGQHYGLIGASAGVALAFLAHYCYMTQLSLRILPELTWFSIAKLYQPAIVISLFTSAFSWLLVKTIKEFTSLDPIVLIVAGVGFLLLYVISLLFYQKLFSNEEFSWFVNILRKNIFTQYEKIFNNKKTSY